ncbi:MAG: histidine phosphatase family protein [Spirochaetota bacterium]
MKERTIYLIRHAEPASDGQRRYLGQTDPELSEKGQVQANALAEKLGVNAISSIYSSDLIRAMTTAKKIAGKFNLPVNQDKRLREIHMGNWENISFEEVQLRFPEEYERRGNDIVNYRTKGGESFADVRGRAVTAFYEIITGTAGNIVIASHSGAIRTILCTIMSVPLETLFSIKIMIDYASVQTIIKNEDELIIDGKAYPVANLEKQISGLKNI